MSASRTATLLDVSANTTGDAFPGYAGPKTFQVVITGTATVVIEATLDGTNYETLVNTTSSGMWWESRPFKDIRAVSSGMSSATAKVYMGYEKGNN